MPLTEKPGCSNNASLHSLFLFQGDILILYNMYLFDYYNLKRNWWPSNSPTTSQPSRIPQLAEGVNYYVMWGLKSILVQLLKKYPYQSGSMEVEMNGMACVVFKWVVLNGWLSSCKSLREWLRSNTIWGAFTYNVICIFYLISAWYIWTLQAWSCKNTISSNSAITQ